MGGGLLQLVAYGAQDVYLTGSPQITFFKVVYRRHTNFAMESIQQTLSGNVGYDSRVTCQISRNGDLIHKMYLVPTITVANASVAVQAFGHYLIDKIEVEIGGQVIDRHYGLWMNIWNELSLPVGKRAGFNKMIGDSSLDVGSHKLHIPLEFWFCRNVGLALPLIALQYHEVRININFAKSIEPNIALNSCELWVDYIFLDTDERRRFAQMSHEYLIDQVQFTGTETVSVNSSPKIRLNFNHPCKEFIWVVRSGTISVGTWNVFNPIMSAKLQLNGNDRFSTRDGDYFYLVQPYQHHENIPMLGGVAGNTPKYINVYSFGLKPEEHQPSGTLNMSRIDTATLNLDTGANGTELWIFATNYNVLRILSGMGGLAYSN